MTYFPYSVPLGDAERASLNLTAPFVQLERVEFNEIDMLGHVNNVIYFRWFETIRVAYLIERGLFPAKEDAFYAVVKWQEAEYVKPLFMNETVAITCRTAQYGRTSFMTEYGAHRVTDDHTTELCAKGRCLVVRMSQADHKKAPLTDGQVRDFSTLDGAINTAK